MVPFLVSIKVTVFVHVFAPKFKIILISPFIIIIIEGVVDKIGLLWIRLTTNDLRRSPGDTCQNTHGKELLSGYEHRCDVDKKLSNMRISGWNGSKDRRRETVAVVEGWTSTGNY